MKTGMNLLLWTTHVTEEHFPLLAKLKTAGFDGVEMPALRRRRRPLQDGAQGARQPRPGAAPPSPSSTPEANPISPDAAVRQAAVERLKWAIEMTAAPGRREPVRAVPLAARRLFRAAGRPPTRRNAPPTCCAKRPSARPRRRCMLAIEYLNRFECYFLTTAADARRLVKHVNHPALPHDVRHLPRQHRGEDARPGDRDLSPTASSTSTSARTTAARRAPATSTGTRRSRRCARCGYDGWLVIEAFGRALPDLAAATKVWRDLFPVAGRGLHAGAAVHQGEMGRDGEIRGENLSGGSGS